MNKILWLVLAAMVVVLIGGGWWLYRSLDSVVASAIRTYGPEITGVTVQVEQVTILPAEGSASIRGLALGNPAGFQTARALAVGEVSLKLDVASLNKDVVLINEILIAQPQLTYEYASGGSNLDVIQRHVEAYIAQKTGPADPQKDSKHEKKVIIEHVYIRGAKADVSAEILKGKTMSVALPDVSIADIGKKQNGVTPAEATRQVVHAVTQSAKKAVLPLNLDGVVDSVKKGASSAVDAVKGLFN